MKKIIFITSVALIFSMLWIVLYPNYTFATDVNTPTQTNDSNYMYMEMLKSFDNVFVTLVNSNKISNASDILGQLAMGRDYCYMTDNTQPNKIFIIVYDHATAIQGGVKLKIYNQNQTEVLVDAYTITTAHTFKLDMTNKPTSYTLTLVNSNEVFNIPAVAYNYFGDSMLQLLKDTGYIGGATDLSTLQSGVGQINQSVVNEGNQTQQAIGSMQNATTNSIGQMSNNIDNRIQQQQAQSQANYDEFSNSNGNSVDTTGLDIDTSFIPDNDSLNIGNFLQGFMSTIQNIMSFDDKDYEITIPFRDNKSYTLTTADITKFYRENTAISSIITLFWTFLFGRFFLSFGMRIMFWIQGGEGGYSSQSLSNVMTEYNVIMKDIMFM